MIIMNLSVYRYSALDINKPYFWKIVIINQTKTLFLVFLNPNGLNFQAEVEWAGVRATSEMIDPDKIGNYLLR
jgi:hypothetical protein